MSAVALITDLMFATKIKSTADAIGVALSVVRQVQAVTDAAKAGANVVIIDLHAEGVDVIDVIKRIKSTDADGHVQQSHGPATLGAEPVVIAFASHVEADLMQAARAAGADDVMPRSRFASELPDLLTRYGQVRDTR